MGYISNSLGYEVEPMLTGIAAVEVALSNAWREAGYPIPFVYDAKDLALHFGEVGDITVTANVIQRLGSPNYSATMTLVREVPIVDLFKSSQRVVTVSVLNI